MNKNNKNLYYFIILCIFFTQFVFAGTASIGSQNGFNAAISGDSSSGQAESSRDENQKFNIKSKDVVEESRSESFEITEDPKNKIFLTLFQNYQNLILSLLSQGKLNKENLHLIFKRDDYFFKAHWSINTDLKLEIYRKALEDLEKNIVSQSRLETFQEKAKVFLSEQLELLGIQQDVKIEVDQQTQEILHPHLITNRNEKENKSLNVVLENGNAAIFTLDQELEQIHLFDLIEKREIYNFKYSGGIKQHLYQIPKQGHPSSLIVFLNQNDELHFLDLETGTNFHPPLLLMEYQEESFNLNILSTVAFGGKDILILHQIDSLPGAGLRNSFHYIDLNSGLKMYESYVFDSLNISFIESKTVQLKNSKKILIIKTIYELRFIDLDTGQDYTYEESSNFFGFKFNKKKKTLYLPISSVTHYYDFFELNNGTLLILLLTLEKWTFIDALTGKEWILPGTPPFQTSSASLNVTAMNNGQTLFTLSLSGGISYFYDLETKKRIHLSPTNKGKSVYKGDLESILLPSGKTILISVESLQAVLREGILQFYSLDTLEEIYHEEASGILKNTIFYKILKINENLIVAAIVTADKKVVFIDLETGLQAFPSYQSRSEIDDIKLISNPSSSDSIRYISLIHKGENPYTSIISLYTAPGNLDLGVRE